ncbi:MAG: AMP-binding protein [Treponema sp.]|jgi:long-chain acyl-CoA synthetase|nr:AMP-binding protein [Treponema sp.]
MLKVNDYVADWPDMPYPNFSGWLDAIASQYQDKAALLYRSGKQTEFSVWSYNHLAEECRRVARGLLAAGLVKGDRVALWSENRPEWIAVWLGAVIAGGIIVPIDFLLTDNECSNILKFTKVKAFFYSARKYEYVSSLPSQGISVDILSCVSSEGTPDFELFGRGAEAQSLPPVSSIAEADPASIVFTSGTTGLAKGVMLSHKGIIANANAAVKMLRPSIDDVFINVLPLHHTYPTTCSFISPLSMGCATIIVERLVGKVVVDDIRDGKGTFLIAVPLLYDKVKAALEQGYNKLPSLARGPLNILRAIALAEAKKGNPKFGRMVFKFVRKRAGLVTIQTMVAGGGPLNPKTADFFDSFGFNILHGYGMSENAPLISVNTPQYKNNVSVGLPVLYTDVKIINRNEDGIGEIAVKSPSLMLGYYENAEATGEVFTEDGYLKTGDLGYIDNEGFIFINGRQKNLIVSSGGKNIYPEEIEAQFEHSRVIGQVLVLGRKEAQFGGEQIIAVTVPHREALAEDYPERELSDAFISGLIKKEIEAVNRKLPVYKKISDFILRQEEFERNAQQKIKRFLYKDYEKPL